VLCGYWLKQMTRLLRAGKRSNRAGPLLAWPPFTVCFRCEERVIGGLSETLRLLRPSWSPPTIKQQRLEGPWQEITIKRVNSHQSLHKLQRQWLRLILTIIFSSNLNLQTSMYFATNCTKTCFKHLTHSLLTVYYIFMLSFGLIWNNTKFK